MCLYVEMEFFFTTDLNEAYKYIAKLVSCILKNEKFLQIENKKNDKNTFSKKKTKERKKE